MSTTQSQLEPTLLEMVHGNLPYGVAAFDRELQLVYANKAWSSFRTGAGRHSDSPPLGTRLAQLLPDVEGLCEAAQECVRAGTIARFPGLASRSEAGERFWDLTLSPIGDAGRAIGLIDLSSDATARVMAERAAAAKARLVAFRGDVSLALASSDDVDTVLQSCAEAMVKHAPAALARIWVLDEVDNVYRLCASAGLNTRLDGTYARIPADWIQEETFRLHDPGVATDPGTYRAQVPEWAEEEGIVARVAYPLVVHGETVGFMLMFARQDFDADTVGELGAVADAIAQFLKRKRAESALREREQIFRNIFESAADGLVIYDLDTMQILESNLAICLMHGYTRAESSRLTRVNLVHPDAVPQLRDYLDRIKQGKIGRVRLLHMRKDGSVFPADVQGSPIVYRGRLAAISIVRDATQEQEAQERLEQRVAERTQELSLLLDVSRNVASMLELQPLLTLILNEVGAAVEYQGAGILTLEGDVLVQAAQRGPDLEGLSPDLRLPVAEAGIIRDLLLGTEPLVIPDVWAEGGPAAAYREAVDEEWLRARPYIRSWLGVPLRVRERSLGLLIVTYGEANHFTDDQVRLLKAVAAQAAVAIENARLVAGARQAAALEERQRLARELHDAVTQTLFSASLIGDVLPTLWTRNPDRAAEALEDLRLLTRGALAEMRTLLFELRPAALTETPLPDLLQYLAHSVTGRTRLPVAATLDQVGILPPDVQIAFYRIAQEALNNVAKHADATQVELRLVQTSGAVELGIRDNGRGFTLDAEHGGHFGLQTMAERATAIGAEFQVMSHAGHGTDIRMVWTAGTMNSAEGA